MLFLHSARFAYPYARQTIFRLILVDIPANLDSLDALHSINSHDSCVVLSLQERRLSLFYAKRRV